MYACLHVCISIIHICYIKAYIKYVYRQTDMSLYIGKHLYTYIYTHIIYMHAYIHACIHVQNTYIRHICIYKHICMDTYMYECMY